MKKTLSYEEQILILEKRIEFIHESCGSEVAESFEKVLAHFIEYSTGMELTVEQFEVSWMLAISQFMK